MHHILRVESVIWMDSQQQNNPSGCQLQSDDNEPRFGGHAGETEESTFIFVYSRSCWLSVWLGDITGASLRGLRWGRKDTFKPDGGRTWGLPCLVPDVKGESVGAQKRDVCVLWEVSKCKHFFAAVKSILNKTNKYLSIYSADNFSLLL